LDRLEQVWAELGVCPDRERCETYFGELIRSEFEPDAGERIELRDAVVLGPEASWVVNPDGVKHNLSSRAALRRILEALAKQRLSGNIQALSVGDLIAAGWPDESPIFEAGANRVYVAVSALRKLGLRDVIERYSGGYRLSPGVAVRFSASLPN
ncbi:MAG: helix-turn-helix domain-containing protein, partial [Myxococcales bacterium]|nr:helix-turn-helix domain-containing protein [Myxococcales bacterium]